MKPYLLNGRTLTHKALVVEMALEGLTTQEIARRIYHTPEAVDNYLRLFDRVLLLRPCPHISHDAHHRSQPKLAGRAPGPG
ncbi:DUF1670 domain-containing protein [Moorellaceae bacterium AZ2]